MTNIPGQDRKSRRSGQAIVMIALSMVVLIAIVGLAVDGGNMYQQRRMMQNAADAGAFAGARLMGQGITADRTIRDEVRAYAAANHCDNPDSNVTVYYTDSAGARLGVLGNSMGNSEPSGTVGIEVVTARTRPTFFLGVVRINTFTVTAVAAAKARSASSAGGGYAIFAKKQGMANGSKVIDWTGGTWTVNGNAHSNSDVNMSGSANIVNGMVENVSGVSPSNLSGKATLTPSANNPVQSTVLPDPVNKTLADFYQGTTSSTNYHYIDMGGNGTTNLSTLLATDATGAKYFPPGIYYVNGNVNFSTGLSLTTPSNVTIVSTGYMIMSTPSMNFTPYSKGVTFFANADDSTAPGKIALNVSGSNGTWKGIIYAPNSGMNMSGSSNTSLQGSLVANTVKLSGSGLSISYDGSYFPAANPAEIILYK